jgi:hypothetical protein
LHDRDIWIYLISNAALQIAHIVLGLCRADSPPTSEIDQNTSWNTTLLQLFRQSWHTEDNKDITMHECGADVSNVLIM